MRNSNIIRIIICYFQMGNSSKDNASFFSFPFQEIDNRDRLLLKNIPQRLDPLVSG